MVLEAIVNGLTTAAGLFWKAFWALALGYAFSSFIQVFATRKATARNLGKGTPKELGIAAGLGFISSSCSFAALSATRTLYTKGASLVSALAYMFASTNLAIEVAFLTYIFLGWEYALGLFVGAPILITIQAVLVKLTYPKKLAEKAREHAKESAEHSVDMTKGLPKKFKEKLKDKKAWKRVAGAYKAEWKMVYKELFFGFLIAGFVATLVPDSFFQALFPTDLPKYLLLPLQTVIAPIISIVTIIGSMGNGPLAAILASNGVLFGAIMTFMYADFNVLPSVKINAKYYGWPFALYIAGITASSAILSGIAVHLIFKFFGLLPQTAKSITDLARFQLDYSFFLNLIALVIAITFLYIARNEKGGHDH